MDDNITYRNQKLFKSSSVNDISQDKSLLFDTTMLSLPNTSINSSQTVIDLQEKVELLSNDLLSAHKEIENLNSENFKLKTDLQKYINIINAYKDIHSPNKRNLTPRTENKHKSTTNKNRTPATNKKQLHISQEIIETPVIGKRQSDALTIQERNYNGQVNNTKSIAINIEYTDIIASEMNHNLTKNVLEDSVLLQNQQKNAQGKAYAKKQNTVENKSSMPINGNQSTNAVRYNVKNKVIIIADQQGRFVQTILQKLLGEKFLVTCFWKRGATLKQVLNTEKSEISLLDKNDFVIVLGGVNDRNPVETQINLINFLNNTQNTNVIVSEVLYNIYLNVKKLNCEFKLMCSQYIHATYISMNYSMFIPDYSSLALHISQLTLREILRIAYKQNFNKYSMERLSVDTAPMYIDKCTQTENIENTNHQNESSPTNKDFFRV